MSRRLVMVSLLLSSCLLQAQRPAVPPKLTLEQAVAIAFARSPVLRQSQFQVQENAARRDQVRAARLPQLSIGMFEALRTVNLEAQGIRFPEIPGVGRPFGSRVGPFSQVDARGFVTQDVVNFSRRFQHQAGNARVEASQADDLDTREQLALTVVVTYITAQRNQASAATLRKQLSLARQLLTITTDRRQQGVASTLDVSRSQQQVNNLQQSLLEAENALTSAKLQLANLIHAEVSADYELADIASFYETRTITESEALQAALESRPDYRAAHAQLRALELDLRSARSERYPTLTFVGDYGQSGTRPFRNLNTYRIQGSLNVPVHLGGRIAADIKQAHSRVEQARAFLDQVRSQLETDVLAALAGVRFAKRQADVADATIRLAQEEVDLSTVRFTTGITDNTEVVNAQDRLSRSEDNRIRALFNLHMARAALQRAIGAAEKTYRP